MNALVITTAAAAIATTQLLFSIFIQLESYYRLD